MTVLTATPDLKATFDKLIENMNVQVNWNGLFVVIDNCMILQGEVRSLFFHFESRKVMTNIIDLEIPAQSIVMIGDNGYIKNVINMLLYAFGKWGNIKGLKVEKDDNQLNQLFKNILGEIDVEPDYTREHFWFYQKGMRIVYEDVVQCAIEHKEKELEVPEEESQGLWHKLIWKQTYENFGVEETTIKERNENRLGNNFYLTSYLCPQCSGKMHAVVYPIGKEFVIDTTEGQVRLARAFTCHNCYRFYTPRPKRLLIDGECYLMDFLGDAAAYADYQELLGKNGDKVSNYNYNEYVNQRLETATATSKRTIEPLELPELKRVIEELQKLSDRDFSELFAQMEEGFYPEEVTEQVQGALWKEQKVRENKAQNEKQKKQNGKSVNSKIGSEATEQKEVTEKIEKYKARLNLFPRLSERQRTELVKQITVDSVISESVRSELLESAKWLRRQDNGTRLKDKIEGARNKNRLVMLRIYGEIEAADLEEPERDKLFGMTGITRDAYEEYRKEKEEPLAAKEQKAVMQGIDGRKTSGDKPVSGEVVKTSYVEKMERRAREATTQEKTYIPEKNDSADRNVVPEKATIREKTASGKNYSQETGKRENTSPAKDIRIIEKRLRSARATDRNELQNILDSLFAGEYDAKEAAPYVKEVRERLQKLDEAYLDRILGNMMQMSSEEGEEAYERLKEADILPELKADALKQLERRLSKIKSDECELLVQKLKKEMAEAGIGENERHHFYPARRVIMKETTKEETEVIDFAKASYGAGIGPFEYPIWLADTSRNKSGDKGMFLTPEHIFYSNLTTSYHISVFSIDSIDASTGLLNKGLYVHLKNGERIKLPYVVEVAMLPKLAEVLESFVKYLQEKPFSRKEVYLAKESHEEICCFRCGFIYKDLEACPKCGYKANR